MLTSELCGYEGPRRVQVAAAVELLHQLVPHRLLPFHPVRLLERGEVEPTVLLHPLAHHLAAVADQAVEQLEVGAEGRDLLEDRRRSVGCRIQPPSALRRDD